MRSALPGSCRQYFNKTPLQIWSGRRVSNSRPQPWQGCALPTELLPRGPACAAHCLVHADNTSTKRRFKSGAGDESRTRDLNLGKVALYQLSYSRVLLLLTSSATSSADQNLLASEKRDYV